MIFATLSNFGSAVTTGVCGLGKIVPVDTTVVGRDLTLNEARVVDERVNFLPSAWV